MGTDRSWRTDQSSGTGRPTPPSPEPPAELLADLTGQHHASLTLLFRSRALADPDWLFLISGGRRWTYSEAFSEMRRFSGFLDRSGIGPGDRVLSYLSNRPEWIWSWFGTMAAGAVYVPLNRHHKGKLLADLIARSQARLVVTDAEGATDLEESGCLRDGLTVLVADAANDELPDGACPYPRDEYEGPWNEASPQETAVIVFTSGTTGRSKAVRLPHNMFCRGADALVAAYRLNREDVFHAWLPLFHIAGMLHCTSSMILAGGAIALFPSFSVSRFWKEVEETGATILSGFANVVALLLNGAGAEPQQTTLRLGIVGGVPAEAKRAFHEHFGATLIETYGMTEMEPLTLPSLDLETPEDSCGLAGRDFELLIVDRDDRCVAPGEVGEIAVRPRVPGVMMLGYEDDEAATVAAWRNLLFHTGDIGYQDANGFLFVKGRKKEMIRRGGENISTWELETLICEHPAVKEAAVVGIPSPLGEEDVKAVVILKPNTELDPASLHDFCRGRMAKFMVPRYIEIREALPRSSVGKVEKERLKSTAPPVWEADDRQGSRR